MRKPLRAMIHRLRASITIAGLVLVTTGCAPYDGVTEEVSFVGADGSRLAGTLVMPHTPAGAVGGVVLLHGAEAATRSMVYRMHANIFLRRGIAVLLFDKRGAGESQGDTDSTTYPQLVEDALAALGLLRAHPGIDPARLGVIGASESGWLTPEIAARVPGLAFVINKVGPCASWRETVAWEIYHDLVADGTSPASAREQAQIWQRIWNYYIAPDSAERDPLNAVLNEWNGRPGSDLPPALRTVDAAYVERISYDPAPFLDSLRVPTLYVYGSEDVNVPTEACVARLTQLRKAGRPVSWHVFQGEGHELGGVGLRGYRFVRGYPELLGDFAAQHLR